jgi:hypothetical protein
MVGAAPPRPNLHGKADPAVVSTITQILDRLDLKSKTNGNSPAATSPTLTAAQIQQVKVALQATGGKAINVSNLIGVLAQPQNASAPSVTSLPSFNSQLSQDGGLVSLLPTNVLYRFDGKSTNPGIWRIIAAAGVLAYGLRSAQPAPGNAGVAYWQTDYNSIYVDNGTNFLYAVGLHVGSDAARLALGISVNDNGFIWVASDTGLLWQVQGGAWVQIVLSSTPSNIVEANLTAQVAAIPPTTLFTPSVTGLYRVRGYGVCTVMGTGAVDTTVSWTDDVQVQSSPLMSSFGLTATGLGAAGTDLVIRCVSGQPVQYSTATPGLGGGAEYDLFIHAEAA